MGATLRYWGTALAVMLGFGWAMAAEFGWIGSRAEARAGGTHGAAHLRRNQAIPLGSGHDVSWRAIERRERRRTRRPSTQYAVIPVPAAGVTLAGASWERTDARYLAGLKYASAPLRQGWMREVRVGTVIAVRTVKGEYAKLRMLRMNGRNDALWEWVVYPAPGAGT